MTPNNNIDLSQENFERIEKYLSGEMTETEIIQFEEQIKKDSFFSFLVEEQKLLHQAVEEQSLQYKLDDFHKKTISKVIPLKSENKKTQLSSSFYKKLSIAASITILIGLGQFLFFNTPSSPQKIFASHFKPDPGLPTTMSTTTNFTFYDAMINYKRGEYETAILKWETLISQKPNNDTLNYFLGVAYLAKKDTQNAILFLNKNLDNNQSIFKEDAIYYTALAKLKNNNIKEAKLLLKTGNSTKSKELLQQLNDL